jgi:hypothetical protein
VCSPSTFWLFALSHLFFAISVARLPSAITGRSLLLPRIPRFPWFPRMPAFAPLRPRHFPLNLLRT